MDRQPTHFLPHGGGPWPFVDLGLDPRELKALRSFLESVPHRCPVAPRAVLVVCAHWEEDLPTVSSGAHPGLLFDYYGFPPESYRLTWPAPGDPALAARACALLRGAGHEAGLDPHRGYDHGTFVPLKLCWPDASMPTVQLSLCRDLDPERHLAIGRALAPLRDEGVLILGSGMSFHNLGALRDPAVGRHSATFDRWLREVATAPREQRDRALVRWEAAPAARAAHPREEHLLPLMVIAGAAGDDIGRTTFDGSMMGWKLSAFQYG